MRPSHDTSVVPLLTVTRMERTVAPSAFTTLSPIEPASVVVATQATNSLARSPLGETHSTVSAVGTDIGELGGDVIDGERP